MKIFFKIILLLAIIAGGFFVWKNYDLTAWYNSCLLRVTKIKVFECFLSMPPKKGEKIQEPPVINIIDCKFIPGSITVPKGTTVTWYNKDKVIHQVIGDNTGNNLIGPDRTYSRFFDQTGTFTFDCDETSSKGQIIVK